MCPIRELLSWSPWIKHYDPLHLITAQGVFGFINKKRCQLVLQYTHNENPGDRDWYDLNFLALPGSPEKMPMPFLSPMQSRVDWQVWIETTASSEDRNGNIQVRGLPPLVQTIIVKILRGDQNVAGLLGEKVKDVIKRKNGKLMPPTAIRFGFYDYTFDVGGKNWWRRTPLTDMPIIDRRTAEEHDQSRMPYNKTFNPYRSRLILLGIVIAYLAMGIASSRGKSYHFFIRLPFIVLGLSIMFIYFIKDYPDVYTSLRTRVMRKLEGKA